MSRPVGGRSIAELCADGRTVPVATGGMHLHTAADKLVLDDDPYLEEAYERPPAPDMTPLSYGPDALGSALTARFLDRLPLEALDRMGYRPLPSLEPDLDLADLGERADEVGLFVEIPTADLAPLRPGRELPLAQHRVTWLDGNRNSTTPHNAVTVRVASRNDRSAGAYRDVDDETAAIAERLPYLSGHIVYGPQSVNLGRPGGLVTHRFGPAVRALGRWLDNDDVAAARAAGATTITLDGYGDLMHRMEWAPHGSQGLVQVEDESGAVSVFLAHRDEQGVAFLDPGTGAAAEFPREPGPVRFTGLPGVMSLPDRVTALRIAGTAAVREPVPIKLPAGAEFYTPESGGTPAQPVVVLGGVASEATSTLENLSRLAGQVGRPIVVVGVGPARTVPAGQVPALRSVIVQFGWTGAVPVAVTRAMLDDGPDSTAVHDVLDGLGTSIVYQITSGMARAAGFTVSSLFGSAWTVRPPATTDGSAPVPAPPVTEGLDAALFGYAAEQNDTPAYGRPPAEVTSFLHTSVRAFAGPTPPIDLRGPQVKKFGPLVTRIASDVREFAPHAAVLHLAETAGPDMVTGYLANPENRGRQVFQTMLTVPGQTPAARKSGVQKMMPHLAALSADENVEDLASTVVLNAIMDYSTNARSDEEIREDIFAHRLYLSGHIKNDYAVLVSELKAAMPPEDGAGYDKVVQWLLDCPEPAEV